MRASGFGLVGAVAAAIVLTACTTVVSGSGAPGSESSHPPSGFPSSAGPTSPPPTPPGPRSAVRASLRRIPAQTPLGDPVTVDFCSMLPGVVSSAGATLRRFTIQRLAGCDLDATTRAGVTFQVTVFADFSSNIAYPRGTRVSRSFGLPVESVPYRDRSCRSAVVDQAVTVEAYSGTGGPESPAIACSAVRTLAPLIAASISQDDYSRVTVASPTVTTLDMCRTLSAAAAATDLGARQVAPYPERFGTACQWQADSQYLYASVRIDTNPVTHAARTVRGHRVFRGGATMPHRDCQMDSDEGPVTADATRELIDVEAYSARPTAGPSMCARAQRALVAILDHASLH
jgi:hypothetical protein